MIRTTAVIADGLGCPGPEEHRTGCLYSIEPGTWVLDLQDQMLRRVEIRYLYRRLEVIDEDRNGEFK